MEIALSLTSGHNDWKQESEASSVADGRNSKAWVGLRRAANAWIRCIGAEQSGRDDVAIAPGEDWGERDSSGTIQSDDQAMQLYRIEVGPADHPAALANRTGLGGVDDGAIGRRRR